MANVDDPFNQSMPPKPPPKRPPLRIADPDLRRDIIISADTHLVTDAMSIALTDDPDIYQRANELVHVVRHEDEEDVRHKVGTPLVRVCPRSWVADRISKVARCLQVPKKGGDARHVGPPQARVLAVVERGTWRGVPHLDGVIEAPSMRPDGSIIQTPGHDKVTRTLYVPNAEFQAIPDEPTHSDAVLAYAHLADVFRDFPYVSEEHKAATVACLATLLVRPAILGSVPAWVFDAAAKRSGKSLQMDVVHLIATGRACSRMTFPDDDEKELESVLASYALAGARVVPFDNVRNGGRGFGGAPIDKCVTATDMVDLRLLGASVLRTLPWRAVIMASGNNVTFCGDMIARVLAPRLESPLENPELVSLRNLRAYALENRASLVSDALTILRAYVVSGRPDVGIRWGGFEAWAALVPSALVWAGAPNPMGARRGTGGDSEDDPVRAVETALVLGWAKLCAELPLGITAAKALVALYPAPKRDEPPDGRDELREAIDTLTGAKPGFTPATAKLAYVLRSLKGSPRGGLRLVSYGDGNAPARWRAVKVG